MLGRISQWNNVYTLHNWQQGVTAIPDADATAINPPILGWTSGTNAPDAYWHAATVAANQAKAFIVSNPDAPVADQTGIAETSQAFRDRVANAIATGLGDQIIQNDSQTIQLLKAVVGEKLKLASDCGLQKNTAGQVRLLLSAFGDIEWFIGTILSNFSGMELPAEAQSLIANLRKMQATIMGRIRQATGINFTDDELKALLEKDPSEAHQMINLNWLVREDKNLSPRFEAAQLDGAENGSPEGEGPIAAQSHSPQEEMIYGSRSNPAKRQKSINTARQKILQELKKITAKVQSLSQASDNGSHLPELFALLQRGLAICMVSEVCDELLPGDLKPSADIQQAKALFQQLGQHRPGVLTPQQPAQK